MEHIIPELDSPYAWDQPDRKDILVGDDTALMTQATWDQLKEYSRSMPTGVYPGKMWKSIDESGQSYLCWYGLVPHDPRVCSNNYRKIVIGDWQTLYGVTNKPVGQAFKTTFGWDVCKSKGIVSITTT